MRRTRILVGAVPEILREILLEVLASEPGFEVMDAGSDVAANGEYPDLAVTMIDEGVPREFRKLFRANPSFRLLGLKEHGRDAFLVELQPQRVSLGELSSQDLVDTIRAAAKRPDFASSLAEM